MAKEPSRREAVRVIRVYVLCEGQTEESFVKELLSPYFFHNDIILIPIICLTKREYSGLKYKGGVSKYAKIKKELIMLCKSHPSEYVTMMFDFYRMPIDTSGFNSIPHFGNLIINKAIYVEDKIKQDIKEMNFIPNILMHEFEGLLFSSPEAFSYCNLSIDILEQLHEIRNEFESPEHIDDGIDSAPSKRILALHPAYNKVADGINIAKDIGITKIISECCHFAAWLRKIMSLRRYD